MNNMHTDSKYYTYFAGENALMISISISFEMCKAMYELIVVKKLSYKYIESLSTWIIKYLY